MTEWGEVGGRWCTKNSKAKSHLALNFDSGLIIHLCCGMTTSSGASKRSALAIMDLASASLAAASSDFKGSTLDSMLRTAQRQWRFRVRS